MFYLHGRDSAAACSCRAFEVLVFEKLGKGEAAFDVGIFIGKDRCIELIRFNDNGCFLLNITFMLWIKHHRFLNLLKTAIQLFYTKLMNLGNGS